MTNFSGENLNSSPDPKGERRENASNKYQAYPEYKDSKVEWLGALPKNWQLAKHKYCASFKKGKNPFELMPDQGDGMLPYLSMDYLRGNSNPIYAKPEKNSYLAKEGQSLIIWDGSNAGEFVKGTLGIVSSTMAAAELFGSFTNSYYWYVCKCLEPEMRRHANGMGIPHVDGDKLKQSILPMPSISEQQHIANFLDHEIAKIDTLIEKQQQLIQLLKEKRQAVISHAVTKGLNPNVPMKDSGVEWLGEVPEHWMVAKYKFCTSRIIVGIAEAATHAYAENGVPIIRSTNIREEGLNYEGMLFIKEYFSEQNESKYLYKNDVVTVRTGYPGTSAVVPEELDKSHCFTNLVASPLSHHNSQFLAEYLNSYIGKKYFELNAWGSAQKNISVPILQEFPIAYPSRDEEDSIVNYIVNQNRKFSLLIAQAESSIKLMQERRTALISAAVTGKIDVRNWQAEAMQSMESK